MSASFPNVFAFPGAQRLPYVNPRTAYEATGNAALWAEDLYFRTADAFQTTRSAVEEITAGYVQGQAKFGRLGVLAGVRSEETKVSGFGYVRVRPATAAQIPDPVARARNDWDNPVNNAGSYTRSFPSVHFTYDFTDRLRAQASWSTSFGRPAFTNLVPTATSATRIRRSPSAIRRLARSIQRTSTSRCSITSGLRASFRSAISGRTSKTTF
jgi:outer membrane receptor protein involved in Fe transport